MAGKKKTTFAKMSREQKVRERRMAKEMRREARKTAEPGEIAAAAPVDEDLSHLDRMDRLDPVIAAAEAPEPAPATR